MKKYLGLGVVLFCWVSLSRVMTDELRSFSVASLSPAWRWARGDQRVSFGSSGGFWEHKRGVDEAEVARLQLVKIRSCARRWLKRLQWLESEQHIRETRWSYCRMKKVAPFFQARASHLRDLLRWGNSMAMPAQPIYRDPAACGG